MRAVYAHFPINCIIQDDGCSVEIRNFLGEKVRPFPNTLLHNTQTPCQTVRHINMLSGVTVSESKAQKDELILVGNDIDHVSQSGACFFFQVLLSGSRLPSYQPHRSRVSAVYGTKIFVNFWTASTCPTKALFPQNDR
jgi:hypothetical protein